MYENSCEKKCVFDEVFDFKKSEQAKKKSSYRTVMGFCVAQANYVE